MNLDKSTIKFLFKGWRKVLPGAFICAAAFSSCSNDEETTFPNYNADIEPGFYIELTIEPQTEIITRATTVDGGGSGYYENGLANERVVDSAIIYLFDGTGTTSTTNGELLCTFSTSSGDPNLMKEATSTDAANTKYSLIQKIDIEDIKKLVGKKVNVYVFANFTPTVATTDTETEFLAKSFSDGTSFGDGFSKKVTTTGSSCPMANYEKFEFDLTSYSATEPDIYDSILQIFNGTYTGTGATPGARLHSITGELKLERMIGRIDYKKATPLTIGSKSVDNIYKLDNHTASVDECNITSGGVYLKLHNMTLFNAGTEAYNIRHTAKEGSRSQAGNIIEPFGFESANTVTSNNVWIADSDWSGTKRFFNPYDEDGIETTVGITTADALTGTSTAYCPWFYVMENTVNSTAKMTLENCTGILFEVQLCNAATGEPYIGNGVGEVRITRNDGYYQVLDFVETKEAEGQNPAEGYYALTYKFLIPHNLGDDNEKADGNTGGIQKDEEGNATTLNPMHYAIVRNNIYQLCLTGIKNLPNYHEPDNVWLIIDVQVMPWTVRFNRMDL